MRYLKQIIHAQRKMGFCSEHNRISPRTHESTIVSEGFKGGTRGAPIMPRDAVSRTANAERNGGHKCARNNIRNMDAMFHTNTKSITIK